jgi:hypothetical protein
MQLMPKLQFHLIVDSQELRLILAGLWGGLKDVQKPQALELQRKLAEQRSAALASMAEAAEDYCDNVRQSQSDGQADPA